MPLTFKNLDWGLDEPEPEPVYCWFIGREVPCASVEVWRVQPDGGHERVMGSDDEPMWVAVDATERELHMLPIPAGKYVFIARDRRGRIRGRAEAEMRPRGWRPSQHDEEVADTEASAHETALAEKEAEIDRLRAELQTTQAALADARHDQGVAEQRIARVEQEARHSVARAEHEMSRRERAYGRRIDALVHRAKRAESRARAQTPARDTSKPTFVDGMLRNPLLLVPAAVKLATVFGLSGGAEVTGAPKETSARTPEPG